MNDFVIEPQKQTKILTEVDLLVVGGSCTGLFAAVRAARLGLKVAIVEKQNGLGGTATGGLVNIWHSFYDADGKEQIIAGLSQETVERLDRVGALEKGEKSNPNAGVWFNSCELKAILDEYIREEKITLYLHSFYTGIIKEDKKIDAVLIENKDGRSAIKAKFFIDATGDGDLARDMQISSYTFKNVQPPTTCFHLEGDMSDVNIAEIVLKHGNEVGLDDDWGWADRIPNSRVTMRADNHVFSVMCDKAEDLTFAEMEGRRKMSAFCNLMNKYGKANEKYTIVSVASHIGIRDTTHYKTKFMATEKSLLLGERYDDAIMNGSYRIDIHHNTVGKSGITFKYLNGLYETFYGKSGERKSGSWREEMGLSDNYAKYYQLPFAALVPEKGENFIFVGRMLDAEEGAFGAIRVMVNLNQLGEAAGVAAFVAINNSQRIDEVSGLEVKKILKISGNV